MISKMIYHNLPLRFKAIALRGIAYALEVEIRRLRKYVPANRNSIDVGANSGVYSYFLSLCSNHVFAYEPNPSLVPILECSRRKNVTLRQFGLSKKQGILPFQIPLDDMGRECTGISSVIKSNEHDNDPSIKKINIEVKTLDQEPLSNIGFIKIDVEGHEGDVIHGGQKLIARDKPVILVEIEQRHMECKIDEVFESVISMGYAGHFYYDGELIDINSFRYALHQEPMVERLESGTFRFKDHRLYGNNFLFRPV